MGVPRLPSACMQQRFTTNSSIFAASVRATNFKLHSGQMYSMQRGENGSSHRSSPRSTQRITANAFYLALSKSALVVKLSIALVKSAAVEQSLRNRWPINPHYHDRIEPQPEEDAHSEHDKEAARTTWGSRCCDCPVDSPVAMCTGFGSRVHLE